MSERPAFLYTGFHRHPFARKVVECFTYDPPEPTKSGQNYGVYKLIALKYFCSELNYLSGHRHP